MKKSPTSKILLYDIETSPNVSFTWGMWEQNVIEIVKHWELLSIAYKWLGDSKIECISRQNEKSDKALMTKWLKIVDEAEIVVAHNGIKFDNKKVNTRLIKHGLTPPSPSKTVDTKQVASRHFNFNGNSLDALGDFLGVGRKHKHNLGFELWKGVMNNDPAYWKIMIEYNKKDVLLLEKVYLKLRPWMNQHPNVSERGRKECPKCKGVNLQKRGIVKTVANTFQQYQCKDCGGWSRGRLALANKPKAVLVNS